MTISMHAASAGVFSEMLKNLAHVLKKAEAWAAERKIDPAVLVNDRLAPDMLPMKRQVQIATDFAKGTMSRLAGVDIPNWPDEEQTLADLQARIAKAREYVASFKPEQVNGSEEKPITVKVAGQDMTMPGTVYLQGFAIPNFYFHMTTAYAILRHNGAPLGKSDYFGRG
jgi:uncharacterized protein